MDDADAIPDLDISTEQICAIVSMARRFDVKDVVTEPDPASNATDDQSLAVLEDHADDPIQIEFVTYVRGMNVDEQVDLVALMWVGRGDGDLDDWQDLRAQAAQSHNSRTAAYLLGVPLLADYLTEALEMLGESCEGVDADRL
jgi:hypothetical protein